MQRATIGVLATAAFIAGCSDSTGVSGDRLTRQEALAVAEDVARTGEAGYTNSRQEATASVAEAPPMKLTFDHASTHPCPTSGRVEIELAVEFEVDADVHSFHYNAHGTLTHQDCAFVKDGVTLTLDGDPDLSFESQASGVGLQLEPFQTEVNGAFNWSASDGREGHCTLDLESVTNFVARTRTVKGDVCGHTIDQTFTWS